MSLYTHNQKESQRTIKTKPLDNKHYLATGASCIGGRKENQDSFFIKGTQSLLAVSVCDGMGGMNGGAIASATAVMTIHEAISELPGDTVTEDTLRQLIDEANRAVYDRAANDQTLLGMGTTATLLIITREAAFLAHVGDSRIYLIRNGKKVYRTFDHSRVFELVEAGVMTEEEARNSNFSNVITRALGIRPKIEVTTAKIPYKDGDRFILCCDGIWNCLPEREVIKMFTKYDSPIKEVDYLIDRIDVIGEENGGMHDNMTVAIVDMKSDSNFQYPATGWVHTLINKLGLSTKSDSDSKS